MTGGAAVPLWSQMRALALAGHDHREALLASAAELEAATAALEALEPGPGAAPVVRRLVRARRSAGLAWWRATGRQVHT